jgi:hypothetical protein
MGLDHLNGDQSDTMISNMTYADIFTSYENSVPMHSSQNATQRSP